MQILVANVIDLVKLYIIIIIKSKQTSNKIRKVGINFCNNKLTVYYNYKLTTGIIII